MAENSPEQPQQTSQLRKLVALCKAIFLEIIPGFTKPIYHFMVAEVKGIGRGWVLCLIIAALFGYAGYKLASYRFSRQLSAATNSFSITNSFSQGVITGLKDQVKDIQKQLDDYKRDTDAQIVNLKIDLNEAKRERDSALQRVAELEALPASAAIIYSNILSLTNVLSAGGSKYRALPNGMFADGAIAQGNPTNTVAEIQSSLRFFNAHDFTNAFEHAKRAIELQSDSMKGIAMATGGLNNEGEHLMYYIGSVAAMNTQKKEEAKQWAEKAAKLKRKDDLSQILYVTTLANLGLTNEAQAALAKAIKVSTNKNAYAELVQVIGSTSTATNK